MKTIRKEIRTCGKSRYRISHETGVEQNVLHRVIVKGGTLMAETAGTLLEYFGYELRKRKRG